MMESIIPEATRVAMEVAARDRLDRLEKLTPQERTDALAFLACCDSETFDEIVGKVTIADGNDNPDSWQLTIRCLEEARWRCRRDVTAQRMPRPA
jgi:hypothetical protein